MRQRLTLFLLFLSYLTSGCQDHPATAPSLGSPFFAAAGVPAGAPGSVVFHSARAGASRIYLMNPDGGDPRPVTSGPGNDIWPDISRTGNLVAFASNRSGNNEIYVLDLRDGSLRNVSNSAGATNNDDNWPRWSPNGQRIAFHSNRSGNYEIYTVDAGGSDLRRVTNNTVLDQWPDWSPNGRTLAFRRGMDVYMADADGEEQNVRQLTFSPAVLDQMPVWSPDGQRLAFMSLRAGYPSVFLMSAEGETSEQPAINLTPKDADDPASAWLSRAPAWSPDGRIYFMSFRPSTNGDVEVFVMNADGNGVIRLTHAAGEDGGPRSGGAPGQIPPPAGETLAPLVHYTVPPAATDPAIDRALASHFVWLDTSARGAPRLLLFMPGANNQPISWQKFEQEAARLGYHVIGLMYQNDVPIVRACTGNTDPNCAERIRLEVLDGVDRSDSVVVTPANSIDNRLTQLLLYLEAQNPAEGWGQFLEGGALKWAQIAVAGQSQGAGQAAIIARERHVDRVIMLSGPPDSRMPDEIDSWVRIGETPVAKYFALYHQRDNFGAGIQKNITALNLALFGNSVLVEASAPPYEGTHVLVTDLQPQRGYAAPNPHQSTGRDDNTPLAPNGTPLLSEAWRYLLGDPPHGGTLY